MECLPKNRILEFNPDTLEHVRKVYNLHEPGRMEQAINILEEWISKQNHFTRKKFDRGYLERALIVCKGSVERTKMQIDSICTFRTLLPKYFEVFDPRKNMKTFFQRNAIVILPKMTKQHNRVCYRIVRDFKTEDLQLLCKWIITLCEYLKAHDYLEGIVLIEDFREANLLDIISKVNISELREVITIVIKGFGARIREIHLIHESKLFDLLMTIVKQILSPKIVSRVKFHENMDTVYDYVDRSIMPVDCGGSERSFDELTNEWLEVLSSEEHMQNMKEMNNARTIEAHRLEEKFNQLYMGMPGSFRNLVVD